jgi:hypothetical protein
MAEGPLDIAYKIVRERGVTSNHFELANDIATALRSAQSQARDEALEEAAVCLDNYSSPTDVGEEMAHMFARRVRALKASKS